jgi:hypothetical protein
MNWHDYFICDPEAGTLTWKARPREHFSSLRGHMTWNARYSGKVAGFAMPAGYRVVSVDSRHYQAHRVIWEMMIGPIPDGMLIDHRDKDPRNNNIRNLRLATRTENNRNCGAKRIGLKGATPLPSGLYRSQIMKDRKNIYLGEFPTEEEAHAAYCRASRDLHGEFSRTS